MQQASLTILIVRASLKFNHRMFLSKNADPRSASGDTSLNENCGKSLGENRKRQFCQKFEAKPVGRVKTAENPARPSPHSWEHRKSQLPTMLLNLPSSFIPFLHHHHSFSFLIIIIMNATKIPVIKIQNCHHESWMSFLFVCWQIEISSAGQSTTSSWPSHYNLYILTIIILAILFIDIRWTFLKQPQALFCKTIHQTAHPLQLYFHRNGS